LYIGGDGVALGYLNRPELTRQKFLPDKFSGRERALLYRTGDLARYRKDGMIEFLGRIDSQVKIRGYRIELGEIEAALMEQPGVKMCAVLAREDEPGDKQLVAYAVPVSKLNMEDLRESLLGKLPKYMVPSHFVVLDSLPLTTNGKVDRKALPAPGAHRRESDEAAVAPEFIDELFADASNRKVAGISRRSTRPQTETEKAIAAIWTEVMRVENPGVYDDFFELGGHSLLAIKIISRIRDVFDVDFPTQSLFERPTIAGLAASLTELRNAKAIAKSIERRKSVGPFALSFAQEQLWFLHEMAFGSPVYNVVDMIRLGGRYNAEAVRKALQELVRRHEALRTVFRFQDGRPVQEVLPAVELAIKEIDLSSLAEQDRDRQWKRVVEEETRRPFDLSRAPLFRVAMVHVSGKEHKLLLTIHHIIADEWSMELIHHEFAVLFNAFSHGQPSPLPELPVQYSDFAAWQREWIQGEVLDRQVAYWKKDLAGAPLVLELPTDKSRPAVQSFRGATEVFELPAELSEQLKTMGREQQATLFMVLEAGFMAFLHRYTGQDDILVGTPISGRTHSEIENLIGDFLNTVVLRAQFSERMSFRSLLQQVRERALGAYAHPDMPFDRLVAELSPERDASHSPLFQVMFILHNAEGVSEVSKVSGNQEFSTGTSKFDLSLVLSETSNGLAGLFEYSTDLFEAETIRRMSGHFRTLLEAIVQNPDLSISKLRMLTEPERSQLVNGWNDTTVVHPGKKPCLHQLFEKQAARTPGKIALVFDGQEMTYRELDARANALANHLRGFGVGPDVLVGLLVERSLDMVVGLLGILKAGGAYVPLDPSFPASRLSYMAEDSKMKVLVTHRGLEENLAVRPSTTVRLDSDWSEIAKGQSASTNPAALSENNLAYVLYTSGSTGKPKGVAIAHAAIVNFVLSMKEEPGFTEADTLLAVTTLSFDIAGLELYLPLITGGKVVIASREDAHDPARLQERINESQCSVMQATPATWRALIHSGWRGSANLKILCGGEALPRDLANELVARCGELWNMYGPTETTVWSAVQRVERGEGPVSIGRPIANTQVYVLDKNRNLVPRGTVGELYIGGDGLARGYLNRDELTRERFVPSPFVRNALMYRTGDLARWLPDGTVECLGRGDNQVKIRGFRIELGEVESALAGHPGVRQCVVVAREDVPGDKLLAAYFVPRDAVASPVPADLRAHLKSALPDYMIPSAFVAMERFPLTPNGKIDRKALPKPHDQSVDSPTESLAPRDVLDQILMQIWSKILRLKHVGLRDNFFELGGHSLAAVHMMAEIKNQTGKTLPLATLFHTSTIEALADVLRKDGWKPSWSSLVPIRPQGSKPPLFLIHGAEGNVLLYRQVTQYLDKDQPVYGLQSQGLNGNDAIFTTFQEMAAAYIKEIKTVQPRGPYNFGGYCLGGVVALEMARQLMEAGEKVERVIMLESYNLKTLSMPKFHLLAPLRFAQNVWFHLANLFAVRREDRRKFLREKMDTTIARLGIRLRAALRSVREMGRERVQEAFPHLKVKKVNDQAAFDYVPQPYDGRVVLIRPKGYFVGQKSYGLGWDGVVRRELEVHELPVYPKGILVEPFCRQLAETLNTSLRCD
jgi:amino acid adenylation domain-containing protein